MQIFLIKNLNKIGSLMIENFVLTDEVVNDLSPKSEVLSYNSRIMELHT